MLPFRRLAPAFRCLFSLSRPITSSVPRRTGTESPSTTNLNNEVQEQERDFEDIDIQEALTERESGPSSYKQFLEEIGNRYKFASPTQWLGSKVPFPMNPSFKPPPPISDEQREMIYRLYWVDPQFYNIRKLSGIFSISLKRVTAILRLKKLEKDWKKGKELQTGFLFGMERLLKAHTHNAVELLQESLNHKEREKNLERLDVHKADLNEGEEQRDLVKVDSEQLPKETIPEDSQEPIPSLERLDVHKADLNEEEEQRDLVKVGFKQLYWETIPEGSQEPILPTSLQEAEKTAISDEIRKKAKANAKFMRLIPDTEVIKTPAYKVLTLTRKSRPTTRFVNVGSAFMNARELEKRQVVSQRNSRIRAMKSLEKKDRFGKK